MSNEDVKWISDAAELEALPLGTHVKDYDGCEWDKRQDGWAFTTAPYARALDSAGLVEHYGPMAVANLPLDHNAPGEDAAYRDWFLGLSQERQDAILAESARIAEDAAAPATVELPRTGMDAAQLTEAIEIVEGVMRNAHMIPQDQFSRQIALTLSRAGYHK